MCLTCFKEFEADEQVCPEDNTTLIPLAASRPEPNVGGAYVINECIAVDGSSCIYSALTIDGKPVAIRHYAGPLTAKDERWKRELVAIMNLQHANIVRVLDFNFDENGVPYEVMELADPDSTLAEKGTVSLDECKRIFSPVCDALEYAHSRGVIHRKLKPSNIFIGTERIAVSDFSYGVQLFAQSMTKCQDLGQSFGSPIYYSPEQCMGKELQPASDMYSLGCVVFEALAGRPPFRGANSIQTAAAHMTAAPPSTGSPEVDAFFAIALAKRPENRFQSGSEFKGALAKLPST